MPNAGTEHPAFIASQFKPGQSGNPAGRPPRKSFEEIVATILDEHVEQLDGDKRELVARIFVDELLCRNSRLIREFLARVWPAPLKHEVSGVNGGPITLADFVQLARDDYRPPPGAPSEDEIPDEEVGVIGRIVLGRKRDA